MFTWKNTSSGSLKRSGSKTIRVDQIDESAQRPLQQVKVTSLEIAPDVATECDPYNSTGRHCVLEIDR
jgi:hypothetical protein